MDSQGSFDQLRSMDMFMDNWTNLDGNQSSRHSPDSQATSDPSGWPTSDPFQQVQGDFSFDEFLNEADTSASTQDLQQRLQSDTPSQSHDDLQFWQASKGYGENSIKDDAFVIDDISALTAPMLSNSDISTSSVIPSGGVPSSSNDSFSMFGESVYLEESNQDLLDASVPRIYSQQQQQQQQQHREGMVLTPRTSRQFQAQSMQSVLKPDNSPILYEEYLPHSTYHGSTSNFNHSGYNSRYGGPGPYSRLTPPGSHDFSSHMGGGGKRHGRKQSISKIPLNELFKLMDLGNNHAEAKAREARIMQILQDSGFDVGGKTWMRDTTADIRRSYMDTLVAKTMEYGYTRATLEKIVRRGTYARMQSNLRKARRKSKASQGRIDERDYANVAGV